MAKKKRGLGRGLEALIGEANTRADSATAQKQSGSSAHGSTEELKEIPIEFLQPGKYQPRRDMHPESLQELANSIKAQGLMQPIVVRPVGHNKYEIIAGERRWRASQMAQLDKIPALIKDVPDNAAIAMALIENIQREDLNPIEEAEALHRLSIEFDLSHQEVADAVGKSRATVSNLLRLMNLGRVARTMLEKGEIEMGHARAILSLPEEQQAQIARLVVSKGLSVRQVEREAQNLNKQEAGSASKTPDKHSADVRRLQNDLSEKVGAPVSIQHTASGKGKLIINYNSLDELDGILAHIK